MHWLSLIYSKKREKHILETADGAHLYFGILHPHQGMQCTSQKSEYRQQHQRGPPRPLPWAIALLFSWTLGFLHLWSVLKSILFLNRKYLGRDSALTAWCPLMAQKLGITVTPLPRHPGRSASLLTGSYHLLWKAEPCHLMTRPHHWPSGAHHLGPTVYSHVHGMLQEEENIHASRRPYDMLIKQNGLLRLWPAPQGHWSLGLSL